MEYLFVVGFAFALLIPVIILYYTQSATIEDEVIGAQAKQAMDQLVNAIDTVYFLGEPSRQTIKIRFPDRIESVSVSDNVIVMRIQNKNSGYDLTGICAANITGTILNYQGVHVIKLTTTNSGVFVEEQ